MDMLDGEYERGHLAGETAAHFAAINGSVERTAEELRELRLAQNDMRLMVQRLADSFDASQEAALKLAQALKAEREDKASALKTERDQRRDGAEQSWSPWQKALAVLLAAVAVAGLVFAIKKG